MIGSEGSYSGIHFNIHRPGGIGVDQGDTEFTPDCPVIIPAGLADGVQLGKDCIGIGQGDFQIKTTRPKMAGYSKGVERSGDGGEGVGI